jgi:adenosylcobyric acid synthase
VKGALLVAGTTSDAGKSTLVAGLCRWLARQGVKVAPFKAQNMALNSYVTVDGSEIGRAQAMQAAAAGAEPEAVMNPVLLKPGADRTQVVVMGRPVADDDAATYQRRKGTLLPVVLDALGDLQSRFDVVICEGAGSPAEINLRVGDIANMGLARAADMPVLVIGDIDRGGLLAALYGTLALLDDADQALIAGFVVNKFRGDSAILAPGLAMLAERTHRPVLGVLPFVDDMIGDAEDSLALDRPAVVPPPPLGRDGLDVAVVRLPRLSNHTDVDALACEPGVSVQLTTNPTDVRRADLVVLPGTKATVASLDFLRARGLDRAIVDRARGGGPILGICGGYQLLGSSIDDPVESRRGRVDGLGVLPVATRFEPDKILARPLGAFLGVPASGYEIRHGRVDPDQVVSGSVIGTTWHGVLEGDEARRALLRWVADHRGLDFVPADVCYAEVREQRLDLLGDLVADHLDTDAIARLIETGTLS